MMKDEILSMAGLARRAGRIVSGEFQCEQAIKKGTAMLVLLAGDASENTQKKFRNMCEYRKIPLCVHGTRESIGEALGCTFRSVAAVTDPGFAQSIEKKYKTKQETAL